MLGSALNARAKVTIEFNVLEENLKECCRIAPCLNQPTVSPCLDADGQHGEKLYAVRVVGDKKMAPLLSLEVSSKLAFLTCNTFKIA